MTERRPEILVAGSNLPLSRPNKRRRDESRNVLSAGGPNKRARLRRSSQPAPCRCLTDQTTQSTRRAATTFDIVADSGLDATAAAAVGFADAFTTSEGDLGSSSRIIAPGLRHTSLRDLVQYVINEGLKVGGRPDSAMAQETEQGEIIEVRTRGSDGTVGQKTIEWSIGSSVPNTLFVDEKDLSKLISCVFLNALKFTDPADGRIRIDARMSSRARYVSVKVSDNGPGIPAAFLPRLFTPFSQGNASITRPSDGLGLGLLVAKGIARKLGGDLMCVRAETVKENHGTEFEIKIPVHAGETISRPSSPFGSPAPRRIATANPGPELDSHHHTPLPPPKIDLPGSPHKPTRASLLSDAITGGDDYSFSHRLPDNGTTVSSTTPASPRSVPTTAAPSPPSSSLPSPPTEPVKIFRPRPRLKKSVSNPDIDRGLARKYPLTFLVAEDNKINRKLLVSMLGKFGYQNIYEAHDGTEAVRQMSIRREPSKQIDVVLMDLWMPLMDGYEATERILGMELEELGGERIHPKTPTVLAVTADVTDAALERAAAVGMKGFMTKPFKLLDLQRLITEYCASHDTSVMN